ncbi:MAG: hypothetical protein OXD29_03375, partial [Roseovarius sp.]|nr:hypothetical protein [Roseovarius sp.]
MTGFNWRTSSRDSALGTGAEAKPDFAGAIMRETACCEPSRPYSPPEKILSSDIRITSVAIAVLNGIF